MRNSVLIIGMGKFGQHLAEKMIELGNDLMVVDKDEEVIDAISPLYNHSLIANCTNEFVVKSLGVSNFDYCIVTITDDFQASLEITNLLKENGAKHIIAKAERDIQAKFLLRNGADEVVYPDKDVAIKLAVKCTEDIFDFIDLGDDHAIFEISVPPAWIKKTIKGLNVRSAFNINILGIKKGAVLNPLPGPNYIFREGDHVLILGRTEDVFKITDETVMKKTIRRIKNEEIRSKLKSESVKKRKKIGLKSKQRAKSRSKTVSKSKSPAAKTGASEEK